MTFFNFRPDPRDNVGVMGYLQNRSATTIHLTLTHFLLVQKGDGERKKCYSPPLLSLLCLLCPHSHALSPSRYESRVMLLELFVIKDHPLGKPRRGLCCRSMPGLQWMMVSIMSLVLVQVPGIIAICPHVGKELRGLLLGLTPSSFSVWKKLNTRAPWGRQLGSAHHGAPGHHPMRALAAEAVSLPPWLCSAPLGTLSDPGLLQGPAWQGEEWPRRAEQLGAVINRAWHRS